MTSLLDVITNELSAHHADNIKVIDFRGFSAEYDYFVIASASNSRLLGAISDYVEKGAIEQGYAIRTIDGDGDSKWIVMDFYDVVVHLFMEEERMFYGLDKLWADRPTTCINAHE